MERKLLFVYNPVSGKSNIKTYLADILNLYTMADFTVTVRPTQSQHDGYEYISKHGGEYDLVSVCGGDGMLNEAVNALMMIEKEKRPPLAYLPAGSTNDFAGTVGIPLDLRHAAKMAVEGTPFFCDAGLFNDKYFAYVAAFGAFTSVSYDTAQEFKNVFGHLAYIMEGIKKLPSIKPSHIKISFDSNTIEGDFLFGMVTNSLQVGGIKNTLSSAISLNDGLFEVILVKAPQKPTDLQAIITGLLMQNISGDGIMSFKASKITFESENEIPWTLDGEFGGNANFVTIENIPRAFSVIV